MSYKAYKGRRDQRVCRRLVLIHMVATNLRGKPTKDQPPKFSHCNPPFVAGRDPHRGKKQSQARDVLVPQEVTPTLLRMSQFRDWASAGHRHYDKLRIFSSLLARCLTINGFLARFTWTGGPWWTMQCRIGTHRWSRFVQRNNIGKCPLLSLLLQV